MAIKIIHRSESRDNVPFRDNCSSCRSVLELAKADCTKRFDKNEEFYSYTCPVCNTINFLSSEAIFERITG